MPTIKRIIETTERTVENLITKEGEFQFLNGGFVREGVPYHIHYTINKKEYYMTGPEHHPLLSKLMIRRKNDSIFSQYINVFPAKREKYLDAHSFDLTEGDLETGYVRRYFAKLKSNSKINSVQPKILYLDRKSVLLDTCKGFTIRYISFNENLHKEYSFINFNPEDVENDAPPIITKIRKRNDI